MLQQGGDTAPILLDLRSRELFCAGRPVGAVSLPAGEAGSLGLLFRFRHDFASDVSAHFAPDQPLLLLCEFGVISHVAANRLREAGHTSVGVITGGFESWAMDELPAEAGRPEGPEWADVLLAEDREAAAAGSLSEADSEYGEEDEDAAVDAEFLRQQQQQQVDAAPWPNNPDGTPCALQPRPYGPLVDESGAVIGAGEDDLESFFGEGAPDLDDDELESILASSDLESAAGAAEAPEAPPAGPTPAAPPPEPAFNTADNALAGDDVDAELASLVAELDAPVRAPGGSSLPATLQSGKSPDRRTNQGKKGAGGKSRRRTAGGMLPAWLVDVSNLNFEQMLADGRMSKLTVKDLKSYLYHTDESLNGNKKELVDRVTACLNKGMGGVNVGPAATNNGTPQPGGDVPLASPPQADAVNGASAPAVNGASSPPDGGDESDELAQLSTLPPPGAGEDQTLFSPDAPAAGSDAADDFLIDEVFSSM